MAPLQLVAMAASSGDQTEGRGGESNEVDGVRQEVSEGCKERRESCCVQALPMK